MKFILIYVLITNGLGIFIMKYDKKKARTKKWRVKESTIFIIAILGGSLGVLYGMRRYRHKTKNRSFIYGIPFIFIVQVVITCFLSFNKTPLSF